MSPFILKRATICVFEGRATASRRETHWLNAKSGASWSPSRPFSWLRRDRTVPAVTVCCVFGFQIIKRPSRSM